jgi:hypothetical protein
LSASTSMPTPLLSAGACPSADPVCALESCWMASA